MNVVDSSGWIEYLVGGHNAAVFATIVQASADLVVPTVVITEVGRWLRAEAASHSLAPELLSLLFRGKVADLDTPLAVASIRPAERRLPLADSIIYATAQALGATLWTQDDDFEGLPGVEYRPKPTP